MSVFGRCILFAIGILLTPPAIAQPESSADTGLIEKLHFTNSRFINNMLKQGVGAMMKQRAEDASQPKGKSEDPYLPYQGKIIRHINIITLNFDCSLADSSRCDNSWGARLGHRFHRTTRPFVIRHNLFIKENTPLNAYKVADNERFIRTLEYIHDARIVVAPIDGNPDSVDINVFTQDLFSITGGASSDGLNPVNATVYDNNLAGMGQRLEFSGLYNHHRKPMWGYGMLYRKNNAMHSFVDVTLAHSTMNINPLTRREESIDYIALSRQLISPYSRFAGSLNVSRNRSYDLFPFPGNVVYKYAYQNLDVWAGYNVAISQLTATNNSIRDRRFFALRYTDRHFTEVPAHIGDRIDPVFNSSRSVLGQFTFFRQDYYKTRYLYGFGTTEDIPYGYNIAIIGGWHKQKDLERPYAGARLSQYVVSTKGDFLQLYLRGGGFLSNGAVQDGTLLMGASLYYRLLPIHQARIRPYINFNYTHIFNRVIYPQLTLNNGFGLRGFLSDSVYGTRRLSVQLEASFYLKRKLLGFSIAPFPYADLAVITPENKTHSASALYTSVGGGIRARNENLIFETIEARAYYFPIAPTSMRGFKVIVTTNVRFRYSSNYVAAPDIVRLNGD